MDLGTAEFDPGEYRITVKANGLGYETAESDNYVYLTVTESSIEEGQISFEVTAEDEILTNEDFTFSAYCPGASSVLVYMDYENDEDWYREGFGEGFADTASYFREGEYTLLAIGYDDEGQEIARSEGILLKVNAPHGYLNVTMPELPESVCADGDGLSFTATKPNGANGFRVWAYYKNGEEDFTTVFGERTNQDSLAVSIPASKLTAGKTLNIEIGAWGTGYNDAYKEAEVEVVEHSPVKHDAVAATCSNPGNTAYWKCDRCGKLFADKNGAADFEHVLIAGDEVVRNTRRHHMRQLRQPAREAGSKAYWSCECGKYYADKDGAPDFDNEMTENSWVVPAKGHKTTLVKAKLATAKANGNTAYYKCTNGCGKFFSDAAGTKEIKANSWIVKKSKMTVKAKKPKAKANKKTVIKKAKAFTVKNAPGKVTFKKLKGDKKIKVAKNGKVTVQKGLTKDKIYKVKVKVTSAKTKNMQRLPRQ